MPIYEFAHPPDFRGVKMEFCENKLQTVANIENLQPSKLTQRLYMNFCKILCYR